MSSSSSRLPMVGRLFMLSVWMVFMAMHGVQSDAMQAKKINAMNKAIRSDGTLQLDSKSFERFTESPRNYTMVVVFTALSSSFSCHHCVTFDKSFRLAAASYQSVGPANSVYFAVLDFDKGREVFRKLKMTHAPVVHLYPAASRGGDGSPIQYDLNSLEAEPFAAFVQEGSGIPFPYQKPFDYQKYAIMLLLLAASAVALKLAYPIISVAAQNFKLWASLSLMTIVTMTSGFMWNQIRQPAYVMPSQDRKSVQYIAPGYSQQYILESQIVAAMYGVIAISMAMLMYHVPTLTSDTKQKMFATVYILLIFFVYSQLISIFKMKNGSYPFKLLF